MNKAIVTTSLFLCTMVYHHSAHAGVAVGGFMGLSGTSTAIVFIDSITDSDGEIIDSASDYGLFTGEIGIVLDLSIHHFGIRAEALAGYYKYRVLDLPNTAYSMYMIGIESYLALGRYGRGTIFGAGFGVFSGSQWDEILGQQVEVYKSHRGYAAWAMIGYRWENIELNVRVRYHHFTHINEIELAVYQGDEYEKFEHDAVFVLRICGWFNIL